MQIFLYHQRVQISRICVDELSYLIFNLHHGSYLKNAFSKITNLTISDPVQEEHVLTITIISVISIIINFTGKNVSVINFTDG